MVIPESTTLGHPVTSPIPPIRWPYLRQEWITSVDDKRIGIMYRILEMLMPIRGLADAMDIR